MTETGPVAILVGAGPRLGEAIARRFGRDGYRVLLVARDDERLSHMAERLRGEGVDASWASADVADAGMLTATVRGLVRRAGRVDVAHHNVSVWRDATAAELTAEQLLADLAGGAASLLALSRAVTPSMSAAGRGTILATGSAAADSPSPAAASLGVQKAALRALVQVLAADLRPRGIHVAMASVNGVLAPAGPVEPDRVAELFAQLADETNAPPETWRTVVPFPS